MSGRHAAPVPPSTLPDVRVRPVGSWGEEVVDPADLRARIDARIAAALAEYATGEVDRNRLRKAWRRIPGTGRADLVLTTTKRGAHRV